LSRRVAIRTFSSLRKGEPKQSSFALVPFATPATIQPHLSAAWEGRQNDALKNAVENAGLASRKVP
jgi:hypothetical protein